MQPTLNPGDFVIYRPIKKGDFSLERGCMVVIRHPLEEKTLIIKRLYEETSLGLDIRGDNELESIDSRQFGPINKLQIKGIVEKVINKE